MAELPTGTVTMVFSDIEGSTVLLSRLGTAYADALDGQRQVLRSAWAAHGGTELGTEGDSFFVVFGTAEGAAAAVTEAQRALQEFGWPGGERVRVRMGVHTGSPMVHDGGYVGMDVHRAARIAAAAHGGQIVLSDATARLVERADLGRGVGLRDLGWHQLKDIALAEHLYQLQVEGLQADFAPLRTLGASSSLPRPATPLVGRNGELAELTALVGSSGMRLVTLTGPGGSGKTRLAVGVAHRLVDVFGDGVYFVPLAAASTAEVMWTTIAEVLDVPPEGRIPPGFFTHVAHRSALLVLDNLEQIAVADEVVAQLLAEAPQVVVVATSRRPLHVAGEHEHPVPPLELPDDDTVGEVGGSGAAQLFVEQARRVRPGFALTLDNAAEVAAVCRRLDGLPLAVELAAARIKLLSPRALLARLDSALDIAATAGQVPSRQKTLRDTISWSYELLSPTLQRFFARLGVFAGSADLEAIEAVTVTDPDGSDPLDLIADLVDASLVTVTETADGEPGIAMLETIRAYALDQLIAGGEHDTIRDRHASHYTAVAERLNPLLNSDQYLEARARFETEHGNLREALAWALHPGEAAGASRNAVQGMRLCGSMDRFWETSGYSSEERRWLELAIERAGGAATSELARCMQRLADTLLLVGELDRAHDCASDSVEMWRGLNNARDLPWGLTSLAGAEQACGQPDRAQSTFEEALSLARQFGDKEQLRRVLSRFAILEGCERRYERQVELDTEALAIARELGNPRVVLIQQHNMAAELREMGRIQQAHEQMRSLIPQHLAFNEPLTLTVVAEDFGAALAELGEHHIAARLLGAAEALRERIGTPRLPSQQADIADAFGKARAALPGEEWDDAYEAGRLTNVDVVLTAAMDVG